MEKNGVTNCRTFGARGLSETSLTSLQRGAPPVATKTKNLSVNNVDLQRYVPERDDRSGEVVERNEAAFELLVSHKQLAKPIEPTVANLDHPAPRFLGWVALLGIGFIAPAHNMGDVAVRLDDQQGWPSTVSGIGTQVLAAPYAGRLALDHDGLQHRIELRDVMLIGPCHDDRQRDATTVHQQVALAPLFFPCRSGLARPPLAPVVP